MASSLLVLIDDIATILDDVAVMTKVAAKKTAGVLGDDLALNAQQVSGVNADRELPVVWAVAKGSMLNKVILVPAALAISVFLPAWVTTVLLMIGGAFLCFEGFEKISHKLLHSKKEGDAHHQEVIDVNTNTQVSAVELEKTKIKGAIRTDFILSAEIIVISLGTVANATFLQKLSVLSLISVVMTVGVYGLVAGIVKIDDLGLWLSKQASNAYQAMGRGLLAFAPWLMKTLSIVGTAAMFLVGGSIIVHGIPLISHAVEALTKGSSLKLGSWVGAVIPTLGDALVGLVVGAIAVGLVTLLSRLKR
jgi:uncharacterized protein